MALSKTKLLFICTANKARSQTAAQVFGEDERFETKSAGVYPISRVLVTSSHLEWADYIIVMEKLNRIALQVMFPDIYVTKKIICLYLPSQYDFMDPELVKLLKSRLFLYF